tara:strand:- start:935 stop:2065 length:1131 start_codon:yes stop_codon:yes gene_type:complete
MNKRILYVVNVDWFFLSHRLPIAQEMMREGYEIHLALKVTTRMDELKSLGFFVHDINISKKGTNLFSELKTLINLYWIIKEIKPNLCHLVTAKGIVHGGIVSKLLNIPSVAAFSGLGHLFSSQRLYLVFIRSLIVLLYKYIFNRENISFIFQNEDDQRKLESLGVIKKNHTFLIKGSGVDLNKFSYFPEKDGIPKVVMMSRLLKQKGIIEFLEAAKILISKDIKAEFIIYGEIDRDSYDSISQKDINEWSKLEEIKFAGHSNNISEILQDVHIVVLPSYYGEGFPKALIEAAASGRAIITTDHPGCRDAIIPGETGLLVPIKDSVELSNSMEYLLKNETIRKNLGKSGREFAEKEFDINSVISKHKEIYLSLLNSN